MVERIKITPTSFVTKDRLGNTTFDSSYFYLKADPTGTFNVGGYARCCAISGDIDSAYNRIVDYTTMGGFPVYNTGINNASTSTKYLYSFSFDVPRFNTLSTANYKQPQGGPILDYRLSNNLPVSLNGTVIGYIRWAQYFWREQGNFQVGGFQAGFCSSSSLLLNNDLITTAGTPYSSGTITVDLSSVTMTRYRQGTNEFLQSYAATNYILYSQGGSSFYTVENPTALSLAVTP